MDCNRSHINIGFPLPENRSQADISEKFPSGNSANTINQNGSFRRIKVQKTIPRKRQSLLNSPGWGFKDAKLVCSSNGSFSAKGNRYELLSGKTFPNLDLIAGLMSMKSFPGRISTNSRPSVYPQPVLKEEFVQVILNLGVLHSYDEDDRVYRAHGQTPQEYLTLKMSSSFERIPDLVLWPNSHEQVERIVEAAVSANVSLIPFGGGTSVSNVFLISKDEHRMVVSLDLSEMCHILWIDERNLTMRVEAGIVGQDLENELESRNLSVGHFPGSYELSTIGGWVATRASGCRTICDGGDIEDLIVSIKVATPKGTFEKELPQLAPKSENLYQNFIGFEGSFGVITEVTLRIRPMTMVQKKHRCLVFPSFEDGYGFFKKISCNCSLPFISLIDNNQYKAGGVWKPGGLNAAIKEKLERAYLTRVKGYSLDKMAVVIMQQEGNPSQVDEQDGLIRELLREYDHVEGGEERGQEAFELVFTFPYISDMLLDHSIATEFFEAFFHWKKILEFTNNIKTRIKKEFESLNINHMTVSCFVYRASESGAYVGTNLNWYQHQLEDFQRVFDFIGTTCRDEASKAGGIIGHYNHKIGQKRDGFSESSIEVLHSLKEQYDPSNIFVANFL